MWVRIRINDDQLNKVKKVLGEYLERECSGFARFYFISLLFCCDEDLLEIIGKIYNTYATSIAKIM